MYQEKVFPYDSSFRSKSLVWASHFSHCSCFSNCGIAFPHDGFHNIIFAGLVGKSDSQKGHAFSNLKHFYEEHPTWLAGYFSYDLKNEIEKLSSAGVDHLQFADIFFYQPKFLLFFIAQEVKILSAGEAPELIYEQILGTPLTPATFTPCELQARVRKEDYLSTVRNIKEHIANGDVYEMNYCTEFFSEGATIDPLQTYLRLIEKSPVPFSVFQKIGEHYAMSASPERFIKKAGSRLITQPIKGTAARFKEAGQDDASKKELRNSEKERAENLMIVDLVRNDLAKSSVPGSVKVEELFGIYSFSQVHQMISTVSSDLREEVPAIEAIESAFPMGSMTGAPKIRAMELIEKYEKTKRGLFSGAIGYFDPEGNFDFNVVIRSILYNSANKYLSFHVGSAITSDSEEEKEYDECMLKAKAMREVLSGNPGVSTHAHV